MTPAKKIAVLGGGIAGLTVAWNLMRRGFAVSLFESSCRPGGVIRSESVDGFLLEHGPNSIQPNETVNELIASVGLSDSVLRANPLHRNRFVVRERRLLPVPLDARGVVRSELFTWKGKLRVLAEPFVSRGTDKESVADFVRRRVGQEFLDYAINPFVSGVYAGDPEQLSVSHAFPRMVELEQRHGSLIRGMFAARTAARRRGVGPSVRTELHSFVSGMEALPLGVAAQLGDRIRLNSRVIGLEPRGSRWTVRLSDASTKPDEFDAVVSCLPMHQFAAVAVPGISVWPELEHPQVTVVGLGYRSAYVAHPLDGFGLLVPEVERDFRILGALFSSTLFPSRAPDGFDLITTFLGGMRHRDVTYLSGDAAVEVAHGDLARLLDIKGPPQFERVVTWTKAIPQYGARYDELLAALERAERSFPGLFFGGSYRGGVSVVDTITSATLLAERVSHAHA